MTQDLRYSILHPITHRVKKLASLTTWSISLLFFLSTAEHQTAELYYKKGRIISPGEIYHGTLAWTSSRRQVYEKLSWKPNGDAFQKSSWNQMSLPIYQGH